jgi:hypothetical protein
MDMRLVSILVVGTLSIAVIAEGAYIVRTRKQMESLSDRLEALAAERDEEFSTAARVWTPPSGAAALPSTRGTGGPESSRLPPPKLVVPPSPLPVPSFTAPPEGEPPLPAGLDTPEAREQLRKFVLAQLERERQEARERMENRREDRERAARERMARELGLSPAESDRLNEIFASAQTARQEVRQRVESGQLQGEGLRREFASLRSQHEQQLRSLLGDERMKKYEELRRSGSGPEGGRWQGGAFGAGGRPGPRGSQGPAGALGSEGGRAVPSAAASNP